MNDANKYVNTYIDLAVGQLHENLNTLLQLKTQLKLANDLNAEKDAIISQLSQDLETNKADNQETIKLREQARKWEEAHNAMAGKVSHLDTALSQISEMKKEVIKREEIIKNLNNKLSALKNPSPKKSINTRVKKEKVMEVNSSPIDNEKRSVDDF